jgi:hypothetical protein
MTGITNKPMISIIVVFKANQGIKYFHTPRNMACKLFYTANDKEIIQFEPQFLK